MNPGGEHHPRKHTHKNHLNTRKIKLRDKTKLAGYISAADGEGFTVIDSKSKVATRIAYPQVKSVQGHNLSTGAKIASASALPRPSFLLFFGLPLAPAVINKMKWVQVEKSSPQRHSAACGRNQNELDEQSSFDTGCKGSRQRTQRDSPWRALRFLNQIVLRA